MRNGNEEGTHIFKMFVAGPTPKTAGLSKNRERGFYETKT